METLVSSSTCSPRKFRDRAFEHLGVKIEPQRVHVTGLLTAEQVSRAPQLQIQSCNPKPGAQIRELSNGRQAASGNRRKLLFAWN